MKLFDRLGKLRDRRRPYCTMIVPAAGESRRMGGGNKLLLPLEGEPVLAHTLQMCIRDRRCDAPRPSPHRTRKEWRSCPAGT